MSEYFQLKCLLHLTQLSKFHQKLSKAYTEKPLKRDGNGTWSKKDFHERDA